MSKQSCKLLVNKQFAIKSDLLTGRRYIGIWTIYSNMIYY